MIMIVDYGMGNLRSVAKAFQACGANVKVSSKKNDVLRASKLVLPGVGAFGAAMRELECRDLIGVIQKKIRSGAPYLGLCLGLQLLFEKSEESDARGSVPGLGILPGVVRRFRGKLKVPHMGWNTIQIIKKNCPLFKELKSGDYFYFVHSYYAEPRDGSCIAAKTPYGVSFASAVWSDNILATQFHPEKSQALGLRLIKNFLG